MDIISSRADFEEADDKYGLSGQLCLCDAGFIAYLWLINGAVNSNSYILVTRLVSNSQKATAAGILAMTYQMAHVTGLIFGVAIVFLEFNGFATK